MIDRVPVGVPGAVPTSPGAADAEVVHRQVRDIPVIAVVVTEHRWQHRVCGCGRVIPVAGSPHL